MKLDDAIKNVAVLGAGGKMGRGIALLLLQEMARRHVADGEAYKLVLMDTQQEALDSLAGYFRPQLEKYAERQGLDPAFPDTALKLMHCSTQLEDAKEAKLIFEAIVENIDVKTQVFQILKKVCVNKPYFLSNTSSIPISVLDEAAGLDQRIIGFHFYNPPPVQRLVELIPADNTDPELMTLSEEIGKCLKKTLVRSHDVAGFIGNGHFVREILYACQQAQQLAKEHSPAESIFVVNSITQDFLIRPMGIFQLLDYVGLDVAQKICKVMSTHIPGATFNDSLINEMLEQGVKGGQNPDGSQKPGFFQYEKGKPCAIWNPQQKNYVSLSELPWVSEVKGKLGQLPKSHEPWKALLKDQERGTKLGTYFKDLFAENSCGAKMAQQFLLESRKIADGLVKDGVAERIEDVNTVLENGFFHLYGPANKFY